MSAFRHGHRFPIVCFHHHLNQAVLIRCGQPLSGHTHKKLKEDVNMLNACLPSRSRGRIIDIRPQNIAFQHMSKGQLKEKVWHVFYKPFSFRWGCGDAGTLSTVEGRTCKI